MKRIAIIILGLTTAALAQQSNTALPPPSAPAGLITVAVAPPFILHDGTPVRLKLGRNLSSHDAITGETVDFEVLEDIKVNDLLVIKRGATANATVTEAESKRRMGRGGKLDVNIDYVRLVDGDKAALRAVKDAKGGGHTGAMTGAMVATAIVFWPAAPLFLLMHGKHHPQGHRDHRLRQR